MNRLVLLLLLTLSAPLLAMPGDAWVSFEPLILGSPVLITQADLAAGAAPAGAGILTGIDAIDAPAGLSGEPGRTIFYSSQVLLAPVAFEPGSDLPSGIPATGAVPSFHRWLASDDAQTIIPQLTLSNESAPLLVSDNSESAEAAVPFTLAAAGIAAYLLRRARRATPHSTTLVRHARTVSRPIAAPPFGGPHQLSR